MDTFNDTLSINLFAQSRLAWCVASKTCGECGCTATRFTDELSRKEFGISGVCQCCQDLIFCEDMSDEG